jgi:hypothetical protein
MADHPLRLKVFMLLCIIDLLLTFQKYWGYFQRSAELYPSPFSTWFWISIIAFFFADFVLLALVWVRNRLGYALALLYLCFEVAIYFIVYPTYPTVFLILESAQLALLLSLLNYFFQKP